MHSWGHVTRKRMSWCIVIPSATAEYVVVVSLSSGCEDCLGMGRGGSPKTVHVHWRWRGKVQSVGVLHNGGLVGSPGGCTVRWPLRVRVLCIVWRSYSGS